MTTSRRSSDLIPVILHSGRSPGVLLISTSTCTWQRNFDSHTAASPGFSGGISFGGFFALKVLVIATGGLRVTSTCASAGVVATPTKKRAASAINQAREGNFIPAC